VRYFGYYLIGIGYDETTCRVEAIFAYIYINVIKETLNNVLWPLGEATLGGITTPRLYK
jgi:hypothetical protein